jgi:hypothetical protein
MSVPQITLSLNELETTTLNPPTLNEPTLNEPTLEEEKVADALISISRGTQVVDAPACSICYKTLTFDDCVVTRCGHHHCSKCFFRWIEVSATCSMCRAPVNSNTHLTDEQMQVEYKEVYKIYVSLLESSHHIGIISQRHIHRNNKLKNECDRLKNESDVLLRRQITLKEQIRETEGYNEGYLAAYLNKFTNKKLKYTSSLFECSRQSHSFMKGFNKGILVELDRLQELEHRYKKRVRRKRKRKNRKIQQTLWECGFQNQDESEDESDILSDLSTDEEMFSASEI